MLHIAGNMHQLDEPHLLTRRISPAVQNSPEKADIYSLSVIRLLHDALIITLSI